MQDQYLYDNRITFALETRAIQLNAENEEAAHSMARFLEAADSVSRLEHGRNPETKYKVNISGNFVNICSERNNLDDVVAALNDLNRLGYITKAKREDLVLQIDKSEDTPERLAQIKAEFIAGIKARREQRQQQVSVGNGSQLLMSPKKNLSAAPASTNGHHQNGNRHTNILKPGGK